MTTKNENRFWTWFDEVRDRIPIRQIEEHANCRRGRIGNSHSARNQPTYAVCEAIASGLKIDLELVLRQAGLLPALPPEVQEEHEAIRLLRRLPETARRVIVTTMRNLLGIGAPASYSVSETQVPYKDRPGTLAEWLAWHIERDGELMTEVERQQCLDLMTHLRDGRGTGAPTGVSVETG